MTVRKVVCPICQAEITRYHYWYEVPNRPQIKFKCPCCLSVTSVYESSLENVKNLDNFV